MTYPEPLRTLGARLTELLDDDQWNNLEPLLHEIGELLSGTPKPPLYWNYEAKPCSKCKHYHDGPRGEQCTAEQPEQIIERIEQFLEQRVTISYRDAARVELRALLRARPTPTDETPQEQVQVITDILRSHETAYIYRGSHWEWSCKCGCTAIRQTWEQCKQQTTTHLSIEIAGQICHKPLKEKSCTGFFPCPKHPSPATTAEQPAMTSNSFTVEQGKSSAYHIETRAEQPAEGTLDEAAWRYLAEHGISRGNEVVAQWHKRMVDFARAALRPSQEKKS